MERYCVNCKKYTVNENWSVKRTKQNRLMLLPNCTVCGMKFFFKKYEEFRIFD